MYKSLIIIILIILFTVAAQAQVYPAGASPYNGYYSYPQGYGSGVPSSPYTSYSGAGVTPSSTGTGYAASNVGWNDPEAIERPKAKAPNTYLCDKISNVKITGTVPDLIEANTQLTVVGTVNKFATTCDGEAYQCRGTKTLQCKQTNSLLKIELKAPNCPAGYPKILETHGEKSVMNWVMLLTLMQMMSQSSGASGGTTSPGDKSPSGPTGPASSSAGPGGSKTPSGLGAGARTGGCPDGKCPKAGAAAAKSATESAEAGTKRGPVGQTTGVDENNNAVDSYTDEEFLADDEREESNVNYQFTESDSEKIFSGDLQAETDEVLRKKVGDTSLTISEDFSQPTQQLTSESSSDCPGGKCPKPTAEVVARHLPITGFVAFPATGMATSGLGGGSMFLLAALLQEQVNPQDCYRVCGKEYWTDIQNACVAAPKCDGDDKVIKQNDCMYGCKETDCGPFESADIEITVKSDKGVTVNTYETKTDSKGRYSFTFKTPNADGQYAVIVTAVKNWDEGIPAPGKNNTGGATLTTSSGRT